MQPPAAATARALITAFSYQTNTKKSLLLVQSAATLLLTVSHFMLGASSGFALNAVCLVRNACYYFQKEGSTPIHIFTSIFAVIMTVLGVLSWQGPISLFMIIGLIINTVFLSLGDAQKLRYSILVTSPMVLIYNVYVFAIGGVLNEILAICSSVIGLMRFRKAKFSKTEKE